MIGEAEESSSSSNDVPYLANAMLIARGEGAFQKLADAIPDIIELRKRFARFKRGHARICCCPTWKHFCLKHLHRSDRHIRQIVEAYTQENPRKKKEQARTRTRQKRDFAGYLAAAMDAVFAWPDDRSLVPAILRLRELANQLELLERKRRGEREKDIAAVLAARN